MEEIMETCWRNGEPVKAVVIGPRAQSAPRCSSRYVSRLPIAETQIVR
jgi:hypothetical protein